MKLDVIVALKSTNSHKYVIHRSYVNFWLIKVSSSIGISQLVFVITIRELNRTGKLIYSLLAIVTNWLNQIGFRNNQSGMIYSRSVTIDKPHWTTQNHCCGIFVRSRKECRVEVDLVAIFSANFHCFVATLNKFFETT